MAETKIIQSTVSGNTYKRIEAQPEKKSLNLSVSKIVDVLIKEALDAREKNKKNKN